jgi:hypothetical protein
MGCLFALIAAVSPRLGIILLWVFTNYVTLVFPNWLLPLLGLIFLPWTTLMYILIAAPAGGVTFWGWLLVMLGLLMDISNYAQSYTSRDEATAMYRPAGRAARA